MPDYKQPKDRTAKGMETAARKNRPGLRRDHAEGFRELLGRLAALPGPRSEAETKAIFYLTACAEYLEQPQTLERFAEKQKAVQDYRIRSGMKVGAGRGRPKKNREV